MPRTIPLEASLSGPDLDRIAVALSSSGLVGDGKVVDARIKVVRLIRPGYPVDIADLLARLAKVPFELAAFKYIYPEWLTLDSPAAPPRIGFGDMHAFHGWACAFRGRGHDRLVSRRWLDYGPWKLHRGEGDVSLVQFHDLDADPATARAQCEIAHARMGPSGEGGFIQSRPLLPEQAPGGDYLPAKRRLRVAVYGRDLTQREMLQARTMVKLQSLGKDRPLDQVTFAFADETEARRNLHELWLRELECVSFVNGVETDLTAGYQPPPPAPPSWP
jgi:hypothetical protein